MTTQQTRWAAWHLHLSTVGAPATDQIVRHVLGPAIDMLHQWQAGTAWFFVRYWQFGPHVRLRVAGLEGDCERQFDLELRARMRDVLGAGPGPLTPAQYLRHAGPLAAAGEGGEPLETGVLWPAGVYRQSYQPEVERYGGAGLLAESEALFCQASELALAFLRLAPPEAARSGLGLRATWAALEALSPDGPPLDGRPDDDRRRRFCQRASAGWLKWAERGGAGDLPILPCPPLRLNPKAPAPVRRWADRVGQAMTRWRAGTGQEGAERILHAHIHMLHNRLGLSVVQELNHYLALTELLGAPMADRAVAG